MARFTNIAEADDNGALLHKHLVPEDLFKSVSKGSDRAPTKREIPLIYNNRKITIQNPTQLDESDLTVFLAFLSLAKNIGVDHTVTDETTGEEYKFIKVTTSIADVLSLMRKTNAGANIEKLRDSIKRLSQIKYYDEGSVSGNDKAYLKINAEHQSLLGHTEIASGANGVEISINYLFSEVLILQETFTYIRMEEYLPLSSLARILYVNLCISINRPMSDNDVKAQQTFNLSTIVERVYPQVKTRVRKPSKQEIARAEDKKRKQEERVSNAFAEIAALKRWDIRVGKSKVSIKRLYNHGDN